MWRFKSNLLGRKRLKDFDLYEIRAKDLRTCLRFEYSWDYQDRAGLGLMGTPR